MVRWNLKSCLQITQRKLSKIIIVRWLHLPAVLTGTNVRLTNKAFYFLIATVCWGVMPWSLKIICRTIGRHLIRDYRYRTKPDIVTFKAHLCQYSTVPYMLRAQHSLKNNSNIWWICISNSKSLASFYLNFLWCHRQLHRRRSNKDRLCRDLIYLIQRCRILSVHHLFPPYQKQSL
jgi:hypothetical protein